MQEPVYIDLLLGARKMTSARANQQNQADTSVAAVDNAVPAHAANERRRKLIKGSLAAGPVILTLASRPSFAWHCKSPSGFVSGNQSHAAVADEGTLSPASWLGMANWPAPFSKTNNNKWPAFYNTTFDGQTFHSGSSINYQTGHSQTVTIRDVMSVSGSLGSYILAALLNLKNGKVPNECLTEAMLFKMFNDCATQGYYLPMSSNTHTQWNAQTVINYLRDNWLVG